MKPDPVLVTRRSLVERLANRSDRRIWQEFFDIYWELIYSVARKAGLNDAEAKDVVQETIIPDHEVLRAVGEGSYGVIWLARTLTGQLRAIKVIDRANFDNERSFQREFAGMSAFEPVSRGHCGFVDILHVGRGEGFFY